MILLYLIVILLVGAFLAWIAGKRNPLWSRVISLAALSIDLVLTMSFSFQPLAPEYKWLG